MSDLLFKTERGIPLMISLTLIIGLICLGSCSSVSSSAANAQNATSSGITDSGNHKGGIYMVTKTPPAEISKYVKDTAIGFTRSSISGEDDPTQTIKGDKMYLGTPYIIWGSFDNYYEYPVISDGKIVSVISVCPDENGEVSASMGKEWIVDEQQSLKKETSEGNPATILSSNATTLCKIGDDVRTVYTNFFSKTPDPNIQFPDKNQYEVVNIMEPLMDIDI